MSGGLGETVAVLAWALGRAVLHSLWQLALVGAAAWLLAVGAGSARLRYAAWCAGLMGGALWFAWTFAGALEARGRAGGQIWAVPGAPVVASGGWAAAPAGGGADPRGAGVDELVAGLWLAGFVCVALRSVGQWRAARRLRVRDVWAPEEPLRALFERARDVAGVSARVRLLVSGVAPGPMVVGWISPVVIVPASVLTMLSTDQLRLVLTHELAHVRRHDHVVNMLQVLVETALFYHPVVWWMSDRARVEREYCCDDAAVNGSGDALAFARALTELETARSRAVLALRRGGSLMKRVKRIVGRESGERVGAARALAVLAAGVLIAGAGYAHAGARGEGPGASPIEMAPDQIGDRDAAGGFVPILRDLPLILGGDDRRAAGEGLDGVRERVIGDGRGFGVSAEALRAREIDEQAILAELEGRIEQRFAPRMRALVESGELSAEAADARIAEARGRALLRAVWLSVERMYQSVVDEGQMTAREANGLLSKIRWERGYFGPAAPDHANDGGVVQDDGGVEADHVIEITIPMIQEPAAPGDDRRGQVEPMPAAEVQGQQGGAIELEIRHEIAGDGESVELEVRVEPRGGAGLSEEERRWLHHGVRSLSDLEKDFPQDDDC